MRVRAFAAVVVLAWAVPAPAATPETEAFAALDAELTASESSPRAAALLYRMRRLLPELEAPDAAAGVFGRVASSSRALPEVRDLARWMLAQVHVDGARMGDARRALDALGFVRKAWVIGGFDNEGGHGHAEAFGPEAASIDLGARHRGKNGRELSWRAAPALEPDGLMPLGEVLRPRASQTSYVLAGLRSDEAGRVTVSLGTSGATKLWVNGALALEDPADHPARFDQRAVAVPLRAGDNWLLLKVATREEPPGVYLRVHCATQEACAREIDLDAARPVMAHVAASAERTQAAPSLAVPGVVDRLAAAAARAPDDARLQRDHAELLEAVRSFDSSERRHQRALEAALRLDPSAPLAWLLLGRWAEDDNLRRYAWGRALAIDPASVEARVSLASDALRRGYARRAHDLWGGSEEQVRSPVEWLAFAESCDALGDSGRAARLRLEGAARFPRSASAALAAARAARGLGRLAHASSLFINAIELRHDAASARQELAALRADAADVDGAARLWAELVALHPSRVGPRLRLGDLLAANGRADEALAILDAAAAAFPDDEAVFEARGRLRVRRGETAAARADFARSLELKPQNPRLRERLRALQPDDPFAAEFLRDAVALAAAEKGRAPGPDDDVIALAVGDVVRVYENGLSARVHQEVLRVVTQRGVEAQRTQEVQYTPGEEEVRVERARVLRPDGTVLEARSEEDRGQEGAVDGMYFDRRVRVVSFPELAPGDVIEWSYRVDAVSQANMFADYFGSLQFLQGLEARREVSWVLVAPSTRTFVANEPRLSGLVHRVEERGGTNGGTKVWRWEARDVPRVEIEPRSPGFSEVAAYLHVSTFRDWSEVARFWWGLVKDQLHVTPDVARAAEEAVAGVPEGDVRARVRAVYGAVVRKTRYVGLEFGIHGFKPYPVDRVLARRFGDCKDKAALMHAMLGHLGIRSQLVLLRMRHLGRLEERPASLAAFNHAILYVPELDQFLDGTAEYAGADELPAADREAFALVVDGEDPRRSKALVTPRAEARENGTASRSLVVVDAQGRARIEGTTRVTGQGAEGWRRHYESTADRAARFEQACSSSYPGARVLAFDVEDPAALERPVEARFTLDAPGLMRPEAGGRALHPFGAPSRYLETLAPLSSRRQPLDLGSGWQNEFAYEIRLPDRHRVAGGPRSAGREGPFGAWSLEVTPREGGASVVGRVRLDGGLVTPAQYPALRAFLGELDQAHSAPLRVEVLP